MSVDRYKREYHLTPRGWAVGSFYFYGTATKTVPLPVDRLLTIVKEVEQSHAFSPEEVSWSEEWRSQDASPQKIGRLLKKFGVRPTHRD